MEDKIGLGGYVLEHIKESISVKQKILEDPRLVKQIHEVASLCVEAYSAGNKVILAGNGGSAADAQHIAAEFVSRFRFDRPGLPSISLSTDTSMLTAIGNDYGYDKIFSRQLQANGKAGDIFIGITTSGNSDNILRAAEECASQGITSIGFLGATGGRVKDKMDISLCVPSHETALIQESHIMLGHIICGYVEDTIFGKQA
jgi:D-sedoheptulose 7-phosphate isomerase